MTIEELFRRVLRAHLGLIVVCALLPVVAVVSYRWSAPAEYEGSVRVQVINDAPQSATQVDALSARVLALATTPQLLREALRESDQRADVQQLSEEDVTTRGLGESPVVQLSVVRGDPDQAGALVAALASTVVDFLNEGTRAQFRETVAGIDEQLAVARDSASRLATELGVAGEGRQRSINAQLITVQATIDRLTTLRDTLTVEDANRGRVVVIDGQAPEVVAVPSPLIPQGALALLLGLLLGTGLAVAVETVRPRLAGARGLARLWNGPVLGHVDDPLVQMRGTLHMVARRQGLEAVVLVGVDAEARERATDLLQLLERTDSEPSPVPVPRSGEDPVALPGHPLRFTDLAGVRPRDERTAGVVLVSSPAPLRRDVEQIEDVVRAMSWPVVGVLAPPRRRRRAR
ncbi:hypothetical protein GCM10027425_15670 [Alteromonas gracilis]